MNQLRAIVVLFGLGLALTAALVTWTISNRTQGTDFVVFGRDRSGCTILVPGAASADELAAAGLLSETLAKSAGRSPKVFPVKRESRWFPWRRGIFVGRTQRLRQTVGNGGKSAPLDRTVTSTATRESLLIYARNSEDIVAAASWWLERTTGAHWFMPGPLGEFVPRREELRLPFESLSYAPPFVSRDLGGLGAAAEGDWHARNRLHGLFDHGHSMSRIFSPAEVQKEPELAPWIERQRFFPAASDGNWQPNIASEKAVEHAAAYLRRQFAREPGRLSAPLAMNDSIRYDQSVATTARVSPLRYFRDRPDYSDLVFGFVNQVAAKVARDFPDRAVTTYAYDWCEDTPRFPVEPNVVPYLTADRSQWFDPAFAAEDRALIQRWVQAGPRVVGLYDYFYGAPFLVPRPTLYAVRQSIPFAFQVGVRAYYAECNPNWGLDGPKLWLAAQLLWNPRQNPQALLDTYYREFWQEAAAPMREFFDLCDRAWLTQERPPYWLKYYKDPEQHLLFPLPLRHQLATRLDQARAAATSRVVAERVAFVAGAFAVTRAFGNFCEARERLSRIGLQRIVDRAEALAALRDYSQRREAVSEAYESIRQQEPLALHEAPLPEYLRNDPRGRVARRLILESGGPDVLRQLAGTIYQTAAERQVLAALRAPGQEEALDSLLQHVWLKPTFDSTTVEYVRLGNWRGHGEPFATRFITMEPRGEGQMIRYQGCKQETLSQWRAATPGAIYVATARVRAAVSPANRTFLIVTFLNPKGAYVDMGATDRLPVGDWSQTENELCVVVRAPAEAAQVGVGVRVLNQVGSDFAEFAEISLRRLE